MSRLYITLFSFFFIACDWARQDNIPSSSQSGKISFEKVADIPLPAGYKRMDAGSNSFGEWLRKVPVKKDTRVYLYNGSLKRNQSAQFAVLDKTVGTKDLQQCADAILRLRAEYFLSQNQISLIRFKATDGTILSFADWRNGIRYKLSGNKLVTYKKEPGSIDIGEDMELFLEIVFSYCGTYSLENETKPIHIADMQPGDMLVKGGSPGHAMIVMDMAMDDKGNKLFMLAQSYMPAQDIHIVKNPVNNALNPWYAVSDSEEIITPEWIFEADQLRKW